MAFELNGPSDPAVLNRRVEKIEKFIFETSHRVVQTAHRIEGSLDRFINQEQKRWREGLGKLSSLEISDFFREVRTGLHELGEIRGVTLPFPLQLFFSEVSIPKLIDSPSQSRVIRDYKKELVNGNPLAKALSPWIEAFEKSESKSPRELAIPLEQLLRDPRFFKLIQPYLYEGDPYGRNQILLDFDLGKDPSGKPLGLEITANVWKPRQRSTPHRHVDQNDDPARGLDTVLRGEHGVEINYIEIQDKEGNKKLVKISEKTLTPFRANIIDDDLIHEVVNQSDEQTLVTFHVYWPPLKIKAPVKGEVLFSEEKSLESKLIDHLFEGLKSSISDLSKQEAYSSDFNFLTY